MKRWGFVVFVLAAAICIAGCSKKTESLEDMQQPMSPEDLNRLSTQNGTIAPAVPGTTPTAMTPVASVVESSATALESLPPSGPYKPTAIEIQTALKYAGFYTGNVDGKVGPKTKAAIEEFQRANGLVVDGKVGPKTWQALGQYLNQAITPTPVAE
ncbi:MAG: peptidoglycan-binding domain-containing protein [Candidatus Omnitrophota bacterium]